MHAIEVHHVSKKFKQQSVLEDIHFTIEKGEIVGIIGPSGTGKTTLIKLMLGMESMDAGQTKICDHLMPNFSVLNKVGYMAQSDALYEELTGKENLTFFGKLYRFEKRGSSAKAGLCCSSDEFDERFIQTRIKLFRRDEAAFVFGDSVAAQSGYTYFG